MTSLVGHPKGLIFSDLKELFALTDGNLSRHLQVLNEAGLIEVWKGFHRNRPQTVCKITDEGKRRFLEYINVLENVDRRRPPRHQPRPRPRRRLPVRRGLVARLSRPEGRPARKTLVPRPMILTGVHSVTQSSRRLQGGFMNVIRADVMGMCFGVRDALKVIAEVGDPTGVTIHGELVHNEEVLSGLEARGFDMAGEGERRALPTTPAVLITAHGVSDRERARLSTAGKRLIDTTCPLVTRAHQAAQGSTTSAISSWSSAAGVTSRSRGSSATWSVSRSSARPTR